MENDQKWATNIVAGMVPEKTGAAKRAILLSSGIVLIGAAVCGGMYWAGLHNIRGHMVEAGVGPRISASLASQVSREVGQLMVGVTLATVAVGGGVLLL